MTLEARYFYNLAVLATVLLWGISLINGTVWALLKTAYLHRLPQGEAFQASYTGIPILDFPIALLVGFFYYGTNGHDHGYQVFLLNAYATLQPAYAWSYIEKARLDRSTPWTQSPVFFGLLWQMFGGAISLPLFYAQHLSLDITSKHLPRQTINQVRSIPYGFLIGAVVPVFIGMYPTWTGPGLRSPKTHQYILAAWQPNPLWVSLIQSGMALIFGRLVLPRYSDARSSSLTAQTTYLLAAAASAISHHHLIWNVLSNSTLADMSLLRLFLPRHIHGPADVSDILVRGPWLFLQYDLIIIVLSSLSWAYLLLSRVDGKLDATWILGAMSVGSVVVGPGAVVSLALWWRERVIYAVHGMGELSQPREGRKKVGVDGMDIQENHRRYPEID